VVARKAGVSRIRGGREPTIVVLPAATTRGRVVDEAGKPWAAVNVSDSLTIFIEKDRGRAAPEQVVLIDDQGRFTAVGLPAGLRCYFYASAPEGTNRPSRYMDVKDAHRFDVPPLVVDRPRPLPTSAGIR
jgi:hypothetical protein